MRDKKLIIAWSIAVILALVIVYLVFVGPSIQGYIVKKQIDAQQAAVNTIIQVVNQQGYVVLNDGSNQSVVLVKYQQPVNQPANQTK